MAELTLTKTRIQAGIYEAVLKSDSADAPEIAAFHLEQKLDGLSVTDDPSLDQTWHVRLEIPSDLLTDGVQTIVLAEVETGETLGRFTIITGEPLDDDLRAEIDLLRAELDMLKKAFRRHCVETS
jgi:hypothetical protein